MIWTGINYKAGLIGPYFQEEFEDSTSNKKTLNSAGFLNSLNEELYWI